MTCVFSPMCDLCTAKQKLYQNMGRERNGGGSDGDEGDRVDARVARRRQDPIGRRLRKIYTDVVEESVPDEFLAILELAEAKQPDEPANGAGAADPEGTPPTQPER